MALATRCPNCQTTFRVVPDQLKLYSGIVRCGVCQQVFNGADHLINDESPAETAQPSSAPVNEAQLPVDSPAATERASDGEEPEELNEELRDMLEKVRSWDQGKDAARQQAVASTELRSLPREEASPAESVYLELDVSDEFAPTELRIDEYSDLDTLESQAVHEELPDISLDLDESEIKSGSARIELELDFDLPESAEDKPAGSSLAKTKNEPDLSDWSDTVSRDDADEPREPSLEMPPELPAFNQAAIDSYLSGPESEEPEKAEYALAALPLVVAPAPEPEFVKKARSRKKSRLLTRVLLAFCSLLLLGTLALQGIYAFHDRIVNRMPLAQPVVAEVCNIFPCETRVSAKIDELSLESTELQNLPNRSNTYALDFVLRNRSSSAQAWPNLELTLNDESGQPAVRRVLSPNEYLGDTHDAVDIEKGIAAESEKTLKLVFSLDNAKAAGYRVYLFYP